MEKGHNKRTANYTQEECWRLVEIIEKFAHIIENKKTNALTWKEKKTAWQDVCLQFNLIGTKNRTWQQLRSKYETLKKETRRAIAKCQIDTLYIGGGSREDKPFNPLYEKIRAIMKLSADGMPSCPDSDYMDAETMDNNVSTCSNTPTLIVNKDSNHSAAHMEQPKNPDLQLQRTNKCNSPTVLIDFALLTTPPEATPKATSVAEANNIADIAEAQLERPKHTALQTRKRRFHDNRNISATGQKLQPWVAVNTELTNLKLKLIKEEWNLKQQREQELHEQRLQLNIQQIAINKLTIEKLKSEIKNMQK